jgi:hypothetical protein
MKKAHEKLLQSEKLATLGILSSSVAHRINNPLGGLRNCIIMLSATATIRLSARVIWISCRRGWTASSRPSPNCCGPPAREGERRRANIADVLAAVMR